MDKFTSTCLQVSEMCQYLVNYPQYVRYLKDVIATDRNGNWDGLLQLVQNLMLVFQDCDSINCLQYASLYLEMRSLLQEHPEIHEKFKLGHFVVKENDGLFKAVLPDMKRE